VIGLVTHTCKTDQPGAGSKSKVVSRWDEGSMVLEGAAAVMDPSSEALPGRKSQCILTVATASW
jgi:hypothetical protein